MKRWALSLSLLMAIAAVGCAARSKPPGKVTGPEARQLVAGGALLLDVRTPSEFADGHIAGAVNIPVQALADRIAEVGDRGRPVVVYCASGRRSAKSAEMLRQAGYQSVRDLGGMSNW